jgi:hypothetical protein
MALPGTPLEARMRREGRLIEKSDYENWYESGCTNIRTRIPMRKLLEGHRRIVETIYEPSRYFDRALRSLERVPQGSWSERMQCFRRLAKAELGQSSANEKPSMFAILRFFVNLYRSFSPEFRKPLKRFLWQVLWRRPEQFPLTPSFILMGYHCYRFTQEHVVPMIEHALIQPDSEQELELQHM